MRPEDVIEQLWPGRAFAIKPLAGITNHNFKVLLEAPDEAVVVRIAGKDTNLLGIDRAVESAAARMASSIEVGPEVVAFVDPPGWLVTRFIEGVQVPPERMREPRNLGRVARALRAIHSADPIPGRFDAHRVVETYAETASSRGVEPPPDYAWAKSISDQIETTRGPQPPIPCHNDLLNANFIDDGERIRIIDWEYAGMGDRFFDLANFSVNHELTEDDDRQLLTAYFGEATDRDLASLRLMRFMSDFREAMWGVLQQAISTLDFDFVTYATDHFTRLRTTASAPQFDNWLRAASPVK
ncbi:MAG: phosphotransferase [Actinomycetota bacterium]